MLILLLDIWNFFFVEKVERYPRISHKKWRKARNFQLQISAYKEIKVYLWRLLAVVIVLIMYPLKLWLTDINFNCFVPGVSSNIYVFTRNFCFEILFNSEHFTTRNNTTTQMKNLIIKMIYNCSAGIPGQEFVNLKKFFHFLSDFLQKFWILPEFTIQFQPMSNMYY